MSLRLRINGCDGTSIDARDRGFRYGDGLFETLRLVRGVAPLWPRHMARLDAGCVRLGLPRPDSAALRREVLELAADLPRASVRIAWSRGVGARGYAPPPSATPTCVLEVAPLEAEDDSAGIAMHLCATRLAAQPLLAGLKHANRLEQVLARAEWQDPTISEGLMCDAQEHAICATAANVFALIDGVLSTPALDCAGVAGVTRAEVLARRATRVRDIPLDELMRASEIFITSSLRGIVPVRRLGTRCFEPGPLARALRQEWIAEGFMDGAA